MPHLPINTSELYLPMSEQPGGFDGRHVFVHVIGSLVFLDDRAADETWERHFVGIVGESAWWAVDVPGGADDPSYGAAVDLRRFFGRANEGEWAAAGRAVQLAEWARTHRYCGRCSTPTVPTSGERSMTCPACGLVAYPRVAPAIIVLVTRGPAGDDQEALLARGATFAGPMFSCLAGFVEPGEDLEGAVVREVREEVGIAVENVRYAGSQPWPFPHSLMVGFRAEYASGELVLDDREITDARWCRRNDLPELPPGISIARKLIDQWVSERH